MVHHFTLDNKYFFQQSIRKVIGLTEDLVEFVTKVSDLKEWFKGYKVDSIELNIEGAVRDGNITKLFVSFEGKGGCKIILKPIEDHLS